ncbi:MAG: isoprenylcysteine carboxylmethyltransferase family protein [Chloroflexota bacterium]
MFWLILGMVLWGIFHSLLASTGIKDLFRRVFGSGFMKSYRLFYNIFAVISIVPILYLMVTLPDGNLYQASFPYDYLMRIGQGVSVFLLLVAVFQTDLLSFAGLRQLFKEEKKGPLITGGLYHFVRHPLYTFSLLILWLSPNMSLNSFIVYTALTIYVLVGIVFEERKLVREFGQEYDQYRSTTPMLIPGLRTRWNKSSQQAS